MRRVTYFARFSYCDDGICVSFPDVPCACTDGETRREAIKMAKEALLCALTVSDTEVSVIYPPSTLEEMEAFPSDEFWEQHEESYEFVPITVIPPTDAYLTKMKTNRRVSLLQNS